MIFKRRLTRTEKLLIVLLTIAIIATILRWNNIKEGAIRSWEIFSIEKWYDRD